MANKHHFDAGVALADDKVYALAGGLDFDEPGVFDELPFELDVCIWEPFHDVALCYMKLGVFKWR